MLSSGTILRSPIPYLMALSEVDSSYSFTNFIHIRDLLVERHRIGVFVLTSPVQ